MDWVRDGRGWPNREASRFVRVNGARWHVQQMGAGPDVLLLHGSGATTHSFASLLPDLALDFRVTAIDLPGHGFSSPLDGARPTLQDVSKGIAALLKKEAIQPVLTIGHSAGAAIAVNMSAAGITSPEALVAINGAFYPFPGFAGHIFPVAAKLLVLNPLVPSLFAFGAGNRRRVCNLIRTTGSHLGDREINLYQRALTSRSHVRGTLAMMAYWDLEPLANQLRVLDLPILQIVGGRDGTIEPDYARRTAKRLRQGRLLMFDKCGHLVHEEMPAEVSSAIRDFAWENNILVSPDCLRKSS